MSVVAIVAIAILGTVYASAATNHDAASSNAAVTTGASPTSGGALHAIIAPKRNIAHLYSSSSTGGTGQVAFSIPNPGKGIYAASFTANFFPQGSPGAPVVFSCYLTRNSAMVAQSTVPSTEASGFYVGVNGGNTVSLANSTVLSLGCGTTDGSTWTFGTRKPQVTLTRLDGKATGSITVPTRKPSSVSATTR
jgi:hypothetical protein